MGIACFVVKLDVGHGIGALHQKEQISRRHLWFDENALRTRLHDPAMHPGQEDDFVPFGAYS